MSTRVFSVLLIVALGGCSSQSGTNASNASGPPAGTPVDGGSEDGGAPSDDAATSSVKPTCGPVATQTKCKDGGDAAIIRGIAHFDATAHPVSTKTGLALFLRHPWILEAGEEKIGGRLHMFSWTKLTADQRTSGTIPFEIDLCGLGPEMWSDENGAFNVVALLDETGGNQASTVGNQQTFQTPREGELAKLVSGVDVSCHGSSPCIDVPLDCVGPACTTITPVKSVACKTPSCPSADAFCSNPSGQN